MSEPGVRGERQPIQLAGLHEVPWEALDALDVRELLQALAANTTSDRRETEELHVNLVNVIYHQQTYDRITPHVVPFLVQLATNQQLEQWQREWLHVDLVALATGPTTTLVEWIDNLPEPPTPIPRKDDDRDAEWASATQDAIGALVPDLLRHWSKEPSVKNRVALAVLAAIYPAHGQAILDELRDATHDLSGNANACIEAAAALIANDTDAAVNAARRLECGLVEIEQLPPADGLVTALWQTVFQMQLSE